MSWSHILVAAADTRAGLHAVAAAEEMARRAPLRLTVVTVLAPEERSPPSALRPWSPLVLRGLAAIEIGRLAEQIGADLLVLGRRLADEGVGARLGSTADGVVRRARVPVLLVPPTQQRFARLVVGLDATQRGLAVLDAAVEFARIVGTGGVAVWVEPGPEWHDPALATGGNGSRRIGQALRHVAAGESAPFAVRVRQGEPVAQLLAEVCDPATDVLVVGARRGGPVHPARPPGVGRSLMHAAPCAILGVPL